MVATDAPLLPHQLKRIATRVSLGIGRQGGFGGNSSGDIFVAFSTANARAWFDDRPVTDVKMLPNDRISPLFQATAQATEAAITNALLAAETMTGANDLRVYALPVDRLLAAMKKYGRRLSRPCGYLRCDHAGPNRSGTSSAVKMPSGVTVRPGPCGVLRGR